MCKCVTNLMSVTKFTHFHSLFCMLSLNCPLHNWTSFPFCRNQPHSERRQTAGQPRLALRRRLPRKTRQIGRQSARPRQRAPQSMHPKAFFMAAKTYILLQFNFVGKLLGPKGNSMKRLQEETMTKMAVLGRGSMRNRQQEEELRRAGDAKFAHLCEDLHVEITAFAPPAEAYARVAYALAEVRKYLIPDANDEIRQEQMREMELLTTHNADDQGGEEGGGGEPNLDNEVGCERFSPENDAHFQAHPDCNGSSPLGKQFSPVRSEFSGSIMASNNSPSPPAAGRSRVFSILERIGGHNKRANNANAYYARAGSSGGGKYRQKSRARREDGAKLGVEECFPQR